MDLGRPRMIRRKSSGIGLSRSSTPSTAAADSYGEDSTASLGGERGGDAAAESLRTTLNKRIGVFGYLRYAHEGKSYWFNTVLLCKEDLAAAFEHRKMRSRTMRLAVLGMSLSALLDINAPHDFLRGLLSLAQEFDSVTDDKFDRKNQRSLFRASTRTRKSNIGASDFSMGMQDAGDTSYLLTPNIPFELDYFQVLFTACDMLVETYQKILACLFPPPTVASPGGFPHPPSNTYGASLYSSTTSASVADRSAASSLTPALTEVVLKIDARLKKISSLLGKDLDVVARSAIKSELELLSGGGDWGGDDGGLNGAGIGEGF